MVDVKVYNPSPHGLVFIHDNPLGLRPRDYHLSHQTWAGLCVLYTLFPRHLFPGNELTHYNFLRSRVNTIWAIPTFYPVPWSTLCPGGSMTELPLPNSLQPSTTTLALLRDRGKIKVFNLGIRNFGREKISGFPKFEKISGLPNFGKL